MQLLTPSGLQGSISSPASVQAMPVLFSRLTATAPAVESGGQPLATGVQSAAVHLATDPMHAPQADAAGLKTRLPNADVTMLCSPPSRGQEPQQRPLLPSVGNAVHDNLPQQQQQQGQPHTISNISPEAADAAIKSEQVESEDAATSPTTTTNAAFMLAGLVSPEPAKRRFSNGSISIAKDTADTTSVEAASPGPSQQGGMAQAGSADASMQSTSNGQHVRASRPGQARLDVLLGLAPCNEDSPSVEQPLSLADDQHATEITQHAAADGSNGDKALVRQMDATCLAGGQDPLIQGLRASDTKRNNGASAEAQPSAAGDSHWPAARMRTDALHLKAEERSAGPSSQPAGDQAPDRSLQVHLGKSNDALPMALRSAADDKTMLQGQTDRAHEQTARQASSPGQPSLSMAAAGCFSNFQMTPRGQAQWRYLISGQQVLSIQLFVCALSPDGFAKFLQVCCLT